MKEGHSGEPMTTSVGSHPQVAPGRQAGMWESLHPQGTGGWGSPEHSPRAGTKVMSSFWGFRNNHQQQEQGQKASTTEGSTASWSRGGRGRRGKAWGSSVGTSALLVGPLDPTNLHQP